MAKSVGEIFIELGLNRNALTRGLAAAAGQVKAFAASPFGGMLAFEGMRMGVNAAVGGLKSVKSFMDQSAFASSDLSEQISATKVRLGEAADEAIKFAQGMQAAGEMPMAESLNGLTAITDSLVKQGVAQDEAIAKAKELQQRFSDVASQENSTASEVQDAFKSLMRGEKDPIENFGVMTDMEKLKATGKPIGLAAADVFLEQTSKAKGDFANTSLSLSNLTKRNEVARGGIMGQVGDALAPAYQAAAWFENQFLKKFADEIMGKMGPAGDKLFSGVYSIGDTILSFTPQIANAFISAANFIASAMQTIGSMIRSPGEYLRLSLLQVGVSIIDLVQKVFPKAFAEVEPGMRAGIEEARKAIAEADKKAGTDEAALKARLEAGSQGAAPGLPAYAPSGALASTKSARSSSFADFFKGIMLPGGDAAKADSKSLQSIDGGIKQLVAIAGGNQSPGVKPIGAMPGVL